MERLGPLTYLDVSGQLWKRHIDHLQVQSDISSDSFHSDHEESPSMVLSSPDSSDTTITLSSDSFESSNDVDPNVSSASVELNTLPKNN